MMKEIIKDSKLKALITNNRTTYVFCTAHSMESFVGKMKTN